MVQPDWDTLAAVHEHFAAIASTLVSEGDEVSPQVFLLGVTGAPPFRMAPLPPAAMATFFGEPSGRDTLANFLRQAFQEGSQLRAMLTRDLGFEPNVIVQVNEAWVASPKDAAEAKELEQGNLRVSERDDKKEALLIVLHLQDYSIPCFHLISPGPPRSCALSPFPDPSMLDSFGGKLAMQDAPGRGKRSSH